MLKVLLIWVFKTDGRLPAVIQILVLSKHKKHRKQGGRYNTSRWKFVPFVQEAHGRLGKEAAEKLGYIATEAVQQSGGSRHEIASKRSRILSSLKSGLSTSLAVQMAQRISGLYPGFGSAAVRHSDPMIKVHLMYIYD